MIELNKQTMLPRFIQRHAILALAVLASLLACVYWLAVASDRYISEAHVVIQSTDMAVGSPDLGSLLGGVQGLSNPIDQLLLRDYLLSIDILKKMDRQVHLRAHYSDPEHDLLSRLWRKNIELEGFYDYYLRRVTVDFDVYVGVLVIKAQAYDPDTAHAITAFLVAEGEQFMNKLAQNLAQAQVDFLSKEIDHIKNTTIQTRQALLSFQNKHGLVSPQGTTENVAGIINRMEGQLSDLRTSRAAMLGYLMPDSANISELNLQIAALEKQIVVEQARLTAPNGKPLSAKTLNTTLEEYQRLEMNAQFAQDLYQGALTALEKGRFEASRTLKKMSVVQAPTQPEYALEPRRIYNSVVCLLVIFLAAGILSLLAAIIRDHQD